MIPAVSIVIATYNRAKLLGATLDSIFAQKFSDFEVIVVDDGSTDETARLVGAYGPRVQYLYQQNQGPSAARNSGVRHAKADWISIQDSDDLCLPNHLEVLHGYVKSHPQVGMVFANGDYLGGPVHNRETIIPQSKSRRLAGAPVRLEDLFDKSIVRLQAGLIAKKCYDEIGGHDERLRICMDLDLAFRLWACYPMAYLDQVVFSYRRHDGNISADQERRLSENIRVIEKLLRENPKAEEILGTGRIRRRLAYRYYRLAKTRLKQGKASEARAALNAAARLAPFNAKYRLYQLQRLATRD
ncbi:MAG TPA: glycosyltransferase [Candidatus Binatia bacterium]|nr:glycosyltransferase [Candidatus Binatia bacterium]